MVPGCVVEEGRRGGCSYPGSLVAASKGCYLLGKGRDIILLS